jgi:hypothetical protein
VSYWTLLYAAPQKLNSKVKVKEAQLKGVFFCRKKTLRVGLGCRLSKSLLIKQSREISKKIITKNSGKWGTFGQRFSIFNIVQSLNLELKLYIVFKSWTEKLTSSYLDGCPSNGETSQ